jgi:hypothetical protein
MSAVSSCGDRPVGGRRLPLAEELHCYKSLCSKYELVVRVISWYECEQGSTGHYWIHHQAMTGENKAG